MHASNRANKTYIPIIMDPDDLPEDYYWCQCEKMYYIDDTENCELCDVPICGDCGKRPHQQVCKCGCVYPEVGSEGYRCTDHRCWCFRVPSTDRKTQLVCRICCGEIPGDRE